MHVQQIEIFTDKRYLCVTGEHLDFTPDELVDATEAFTRLAAKVAREGGTKAGRKTDGARSDGAEPSGQPALGRSSAPTRIHASTRLAPDAPPSSETIRSRASPRSSWPAMSAAKSEHDALTRALDQGGDRLIQGREPALHAFHDLGVMVPAAIVDCDKRHTRLDQAAGQEGALAIGVAPKSTRRAKVPVAIIHLPALIKQNSTTTSSEEFYVSETWKRSLQKSKPPGQCCVTWLSIKKSDGAKPEYIGYSLSPATLPLSN